MRRRVTTDVRWRTGCVGLVSVDSELAWRCRPLTTPGGRCRVRRVLARHWRQGRAVDGGGLDLDATDNVPALVNRPRLSLSASVEGEHWLAGIVNAGPDGRQAPPPPLDLGSQEPNRAGSNGHRDSP